ncbi:peptide-n4-(n-acetyl-beta-glucosaminyl) asparagine amidase a [Lentinula edodes]|uniref:Peptide-n4-(N-acetyl-beta-glucosaminyl) asparagine amidase a n=1 Tax=Lentinula edodes TaxID=5353 RepID=A0A1Q3ET28_LENED|nr:peptide-n4-(n-acetyl-beta-glucosaminyl) asparagine amidase a [Lentinula edodes]
MTISSHDFANSFVDGPAITQLSPPEDCGPVGSWAAITLNLTVTTNGTQFDRLGIFTFHNVEIWRTSTFEPTIGDGIVWTYIKDVTQYMPLFTESGEFLLELDNLIETGLDGIYSTTVAATYFESSAEYPPAEKADIIIPISTLSNTTADDASVPPAFSLNITVPNNTVAIYAEIFASGNGLEEDWFFNVPDEFFSNISPNITSPHDGFREVRLLIDGLVAGVAFPYITVFSGVGLHSILLATNRELWYCRIAYLFCRCHPVCSIID